MYCIELSTAGKHGSPLMAWNNRVEPMCLNKGEKEDRDDESPVIIFILPVHFHLSSDLWPCIDYDA